MFDNFEYGLAAKEYEKDRSEGKTSNKQLENLAFCYLVLNDANNGLTLSESLIKNGSSLVELWYWKAHFQRELKLYNQAVESAVKYLELGGQNLPLKFKESCYILENTPEFIEGTITEFSQNDGKSNMIQFSDNTSVYYFETGLDSLSNELGFADGKEPNAELLLMKPYLFENDKFSEWVVLNENGGKDFSVNSIQFDPERKRVYFSATQPGTNDELKIVSHIYTASLDQTGMVITDFEPMKFSGFEDSSSCAHVTLSADGSTLVFSKLQKGKDDADLWYSTLSGNEWSSAKPISGINTLGNELFPSFSGDSLFLFSSDGIIGYGGLDVFSVAYNGSMDNFKEDEIDRLPLPLNSVSDDFWLSYLNTDSLVINSNRSGGKGEDDVWSFRKPIPIIETEPLPDPEPVKPEFDLDAFLKECNSKKVFFAFKDGVTSEQFDYVEKLKELIDEGYKFNIQVTGYADARGTTAKNYEMGLKRAESVKTNLISRGIPTEILKVVSIGSTKIENRCQTQWVECTEEEHKVNRYVQLTITKVE